MLLLYFVAAGLLLGRLAGGRLGALSQVRFHWWQTALGGLMFQLVLFSAPVATSVGDAGPPLYVGSSLAVLAALLLNLRQPGFRLIAYGAALNLLPILTNGGYMPSAPEAWLSLTGTAAVPTDEYTNSILMTPSTAFPALGDIFVLPRPLPLANVFSIGDVLIGVGAAVFLVRAMRAGVASSAGRAVLSVRRPAAS
jgi:hypothetical protein